MTNTIIKVENLSKQYRIGGRKESYGSFRESLSNAVSNSLRRIRNPRSLSQQDTIWALKDVSFDVNQGEVVGIIGRNGAGKSTLLKILSRITKPTEGTVRLRGRVGSLLEVGTGFHPELTGRENIYLNGAILGMSRVEIANKFDEIVDFSEIGKFLDTPVKRFSSGMYVRLAFAVAAHLEPEILLVDEVLAVGDAAFQKKCLGKMGEVAEGGRTVLFVSHNMSAIQSLCSRAILINAGNLIFDEEPRSVIRSYLHQVSVGDEFSRMIVYENINAKAQITKVTLTSSLQPDNTISYTKPISFEILCLAKESGISFYLGINILNAQGDRIIFWRDIELLPKLGAPRNSGLYQYTITIPEHVLIPGKYRVELALVEPLSYKHIHIPDKHVVFEVVDNSSERRAMGFPWKGLTAIPLKLEVNYKDTID
ncbi:ABC transporter ATP-binding protein [Chloroflexota bacterium]